MAVRPYGLVALMGLALMGCQVQGDSQLTKPGHWQVKTLASYTKPLAHEGPLFLAERQQLFFTSNRLRRPDGSQYVVVSLFDLKKGTTTNLGLTESIPMANGAFRLQDGSIAVAMQGNKLKPAGIATYNLDTKVVKVLTKGFSGYQFNSPNDIVQSRDQAIWFTDPQYGYEQGFRPKPGMGNWVWRINRDGVSQRLLIDGFSKPNGIAMSRDQRYIYVTDTGYIAGNGVRNSVLPRTIYRFKVMTTPAGPLASERITFAVASQGVPDGIKVDKAGRVWTGTGAGLEIFSADGVPLQTIPFPNGVSNFALDEETGGAFVMGETRLYQVLPQSAPTISRLWPSGSRTVKPS